MLCCGNWQGRIGTLWQDGLRKRSQNVDAKRQNGKSDAQKSSNELIARRVSRRHRLTSQAARKTRKRPSTSSQPDFCGEVDYTAQSLGTLRSVPRHGARNPAAPSSSPETSVWADTRAAAGFRPGQAASQSKTYAIPTTWYAIGVAKQQLRGARRCDRRVQANPDTAHRRISEQVRCIRLSSRQDYRVGGAVAATSGNVAACAGVDGFDVSKLCPTAANGMARAVDICRCGHRWLSTLQSWATHTSSYPLGAPRIHPEQSALTGIATSFDRALTRFVVIVRVRSVR